jgi:energy-coupling factor transporter ATP-binding protein EcfA2
VEDALVVDVDDAAPPAPPPPLAEDAVDEVVSAPPPPVVLPALPVVPLPGPVVEPVGAPPAPLPFDPVQAADPPRMQATRTTARRTRGAMGMGDLPARAPLRGGGAAFTQELLRSPAVSGYRPRMATPRRRKKAPEIHDGGGGGKLVLRNVRCFADAEVPLGERVTVVIGHNGSGKTTIAEAIGCLVRGEGEGLKEFPLRKGETEGEIALYGAGGEMLGRWRDPSESGRAWIGGKVFVYGQYRALRPPRWWEVGVSTVAPPLPEDLADAVHRPVTRTLFEFDEYLFRDLSAYVALVADQGEHDPAARRVWERIRAWLRDREGARLDDVEVVGVKGRRVAAFRRAGVTLPIAELSDGYRALLAIVLDLAIRYLQEFSKLDDPLAGEALVVVDEVDLNLHPRWQRRVIEQLTRLFPGTRFVLTTHSPTIVQAAIDERHQVVVLEEKDGGTVASALKKGELKRLDGAEVESVLVEVFGLPSRYSPTYEAVENRATELREKVEDETATAVERRELFHVLDELQGLLAREEERVGTGPLMSEIARSQIAFLKGFVAKTSSKKKTPKRKVGRHGSAPAKRR